MATPGEICPIYWRDELEGSIRAAYPDVNREERRRLTRHYTKTRIIPLEIAEAWEATYGKPSSETSEG